MQDERMSEIMKSSLDGIQSIADMNALVGRPIHTPGGTTVIPISKVSLGFATGGVDIPLKRGHEHKSFGGGGGTSVTVTPMAFLAIDKLGAVSLIPMDGRESSASKIEAIIDRAPEIIDKIKRIIN